MSAHQETRRRFFKQSLAASAGAMAFTPAFRAGAAERPTGRIKAGQIGTRHAHAAGKLAALLKLEELFEVVGVVEPDADRRRAVMAKAPYSRVKWVSEDELLGRADVQAVAVETSVADLVPTALRCIKAGKHIHLDKPAGFSMKACRELHSEATRRGLTIQMGYMLRYNPAFQFLFEVLEKGWLGRITEVSGMMGKLASQGLRKELADFEGGGMFELSCHIIDSLITVLGRPESVTAWSHRSYPKRDSFADNQLAVFDYPHAIATIRCNHLDPLGFARRYFNVTGENGTLEIAPLEPPRVRLGLDRPRGEFKKGFQDVPMPRASGRYDAEFEDLASVIRGGKRLAWDAEHDLIVHESVLRASAMPLDD